MQRSINIGVVSLLRFAKKIAWHDKKNIHFHSFFHDRHSPRGGKEFAMKFSTVATLVVAAMLLVACGGGGGGSPASSQPSQPTADTTAPTLTLATSSPASTTTTVVFTSSEDLAGNVSVTIKDASGATISGSTILNSGNRGMTWTPGGALACNTTYTATAVGADLAGNTGTATSTVTTVGCSALWPPTTIAPINQKVIGLNVLSGTNVLIGDAAWQAAVTNNTVKFSDTGMVMTGLDTRPILWAMYQFNNMWCTVPVHKDDGSPSKGLEPAGSVCNTESIDYMIGTPAGLIRHFTNRDQCFERRWNQNPPSITDTQVPCP